MKKKVKQAKYSKVMVIAKKKKQLASTVTENKITLEQIYMFNYLE